MEQKNIEKEENCAMQILGEFSDLDYTDVVNQLKLMNFSVEKVLWHYRQQMNVHVCLTSCQDVEKKVFLVFKNKDSGMDLIV